MENFAAFLEMQEKYDYIILDLPPALNSLTQAVISVCDSVFVPIELATFAIQGVTNVTDMIVKTGTNFGGCFVTKFDKKNSADRELLEILRSNLGAKAMESVIPLSRIIKNSINFKLTAAEYMGWTEAGKSYEKLTSEILETV